MQASEFSSLVDSSRNQVGLCALTLLVWIAVCDGRLSEEEEKELLQVADDLENSEGIRNLILLAIQGSLEPVLMKTCSVLRVLDVDHKKLLLEMAIGMALQDGYLTVAEIHVLEFIVDLFGFQQSDLNRLFEDSTGKPCPRAGDPSSLDWWKAREKARSSDSSSRGGREGSGARASETRRDDLDRLRNLAILGLDEEASEEDIKIAYRRMAKVHHPDRFASLGEEGVAAQTITFKRIQAAYRRLSEA